MSLLNQVLQDLQDRQAPGINTAQVTLRDVRIPARGSAHATHRPWVLWTAIIILAGLSGNLLWQRGQHAATTIPVPPNRTPPSTPALAAAPAQARTVPPSLPAKAQAKASAPTAAPNHTIPTTAASVGHSIATEHAPAPAHDKEPMPDPHRQDTVHTTLAPQASVPADAPATALGITAAKETTATIAAPISKPMPEPRPAAIEKTARALSPQQQAELAYQDALRLLQSGRPSVAEPRLRTALDSDPAHRAARTTLAGLLINAGRLPEATSLLAAGLTMAPTYAPFAKLYARLRIDQGELGDARTVLERAAPAVQDDPEYHALLAALYQRLGLYQQAAQTYRGALQAQPRNGVWWLGLGLALEGAGDRSEALQAYQRAQQSGTLDSDVLHYVESKITALR